MFKSAMIKHWVWRQRGLMFDSSSEIFHSLSFINSFKFKNVCRLFPLPCLLLSRFSPENMARNWDFNQDIIIYSWQLLTRTESESKESSVSNETPLKVLKYCDISRYPRAAKSAQNKRGVWWMIVWWKRKHKQITLFMSRNIWNCRVPTIPLGWKIKKIWFNSSWEDKRLVRVEHGVTSVIKEPGLTEGSLGLDAIGPEVRALAFWLVCLEATTINLKTFFRIDF